WRRHPSTGGASAPEARRSALPGRLPGRRRFPGADLLLRDAEGFQRDRHPAVEGHLHENLLDLRGRDADVARPLEMAAQIIVTAAYGEGRDGEDGPCVEMQRGARVHATEGELVGEPQEVVGQAAMGDWALLPRSEELSLHLEPLAVCLLAHRRPPAPRSASS